MTLLESLVNVSNTFISNTVLLKLVTSLLILFTGFIIGRIIGKVVLKVLKEIEFDKTLKKATGIESKFSKNISNLSSYFIYFLAVIMALESVGLTPFVLNTISAVLIIIIAISVILAVKDFIPNFIGGYTFRRKRLFKKGEKIRIGEIEGKIKKINLIDTYIVTSKNDLIIIPNSLFIKSIVQKKNH